MTENISLIQTGMKSKDATCWGTGYHLAMMPSGLHDIGGVKDHTSCGKNVICINRTCQSISILDVTVFRKSTTNRDVQKKEISAL